MVSKKSLNFWTEVKNIFKKISDKFDAEWQKRKRILSTQLLVAIILKLVQSKSRQGYSINLIQFWEVCTEKNIELPQVNSIAASSLCEARQKLSEDIFKELNQELINHWQKNQDLPTWNNHRIFAVDGSRVNVPRELINDGYKLYAEERGRYYPQGLMSCLYNLQEKVISDFSFVTHMNERLCALEHMKQLTEKDIIVFDRGYFSYLLLYKVVEQGIQGIFRLQVQESGTNSKVLDFWNSQQDDTVIEYMPSITVIRDLKKKGFDLDIKPLSVRLIKHKINNEIYVYATTLISEAYPKECFAEIYHGRWGIEELYKISKQFIGIEDFHAKTARGVKQELYAHLLLINLSRFVEFEAKHLLPSPIKGGTDIDNTEQRILTIFLVLL
ncbi:IS4 family transposase [Candidatus Tisiphia endosymbiont of Temnostethus pusillus]|uniref:IS4 family transposase n=1 Tax=Candidatus Tisiphia endosymbiont of Temnostethus pusillus TaxID=3139335 RepID=UPI0035C921DB